MKWVNKTSFVDGAPPGVNEFKEPPGIISSSYNVQFFKNKKYLRNCMCYKHQPFVYKPDRMQIETFIVHIPCIFSAFAIVY